MSEVKVVRLHEYESGLDRQVIEGSDKEEEFVSLVASGISDVDELSKRLSINPRAVVKSLRNQHLLGLIKSAIQARAVTMMPKILETAYGDTEDKRARVRQMAREYIRKIAEGEPSIIQQNNQISAWDPAYDERLFERGRQMFKELAEVTAEATVQHFMDEDGEGESR